ncbi:MAG TPA: transaldolase family protein, partial [Streptomyces sp.]
HVVEAFLTGMEQAVKAGRDPSRIASVASFFVSRVDAEIDKRLDRLGSAQAVVLRGRAAIANARIAYEHYEKAFSSERWKRLEAAGARPQRLLWASTSVKDPAYEDTRYVVDLVAPDVVNTMPEATLEAVANHGTVPSGSVRGTYTDAHTVLEELAVLGVDYTDVVQGLEDDGVAKFDASWDKLAGKLASRLSRNQPGDDRTER